MTDAQSSRCAIYTRKSSEEGLDQPFNSLDAQREACEAYVKSQASEGWELRGDRYDDGGYSGGSMERPALRRLLADIAAGKIDTVVVYKVDRLTRALPDFAKMIDSFDKTGVSFVSVTQAFNTTTSIGRLTLNVLLSFAQFEREITGERIRDKIAASKAKGMWMGGVPPLGYDPPAGSESRALVVNETEAETVRLIFRRYIKLGNQLSLQRSLEKDGIRSKRWLSNGHEMIGGYAFSRGALNHLLRNRIYLGVIRHKGVDHAGRHPAILDDKKTFSAAQALLACNRRKRQEHRPKAAASLLYGRLFDCDGQMMEVVNAGRPPRAYCYYVSEPTLKRSRDSSDSDKIRRVSARAIEELFLEHLNPILHREDAAPDQERIRALIDRVEIHPATVHMVLRLKAIARQWQQRASLEAVRCRLAPGDRISIEPYDENLVRIFVPVRLKVRGGRKWIVDSEGKIGSAPLPPDRHLIQRVRAAHSALLEYGARPGARPSVLRRAKAPKDTVPIRLLQWAFLAPDIQRGILDGSLTVRPELRPPADLDIPLLWPEQRELFRSLAAERSG